MDAPEFPPTGHYAASRVPVRALMLMHDAEAAAKAAPATAMEGRRNVYLATVAHEMRNAIGPLTCLVDILALRAADSPELSELVPVARRQMRQLARLTEDLLDLGRAANDEFRMELQREDARDIVGAAAAAWSILARMKGQIVKVSMPDEPLVVLADRLRLGQAIQNILGNAIKFTPDGGAIGVAVLRSAKSIRIEVTDSGIGIAESDIAHIFEMFYSVGGVHGPTTGFGIGLALAAKLVALQGGSISASSDGLGRGSTFVIELPLAVTLQAA